LDFSKLLELSLQFFDSPLDVSPWAEVPPSPFAFLEDLRVLLI
jgi:hypothetical protein